jgi:ketosteroid isomerase-like protein
VLTIKASVDGAAITLDGRPLGSSPLPNEIFVDAGDHVVAIGRTRGTVNATGKAFDVPVAHVWTVRDGLVRRVEYYIDDPTMLAAL